MKIQNLERRSSALVEPLAMDACLRASGDHARLRGDARGGDGGVREELAAGVVEAGDGGGNKRNPTLLGREDCTLVAWYRFLYAPRTGGRMTVTIGRRKLLAALGGAAIAWPLAARAQQPAMPVVGFLDSRSADVRTDRLRAFRQGLKDTGYVEGENVAIVYRFAENQIGRLPELAADLVRRQVAVIATGGAPAAFATKAATATIPTIFLVGDDPVRLGLVTSLARPGGDLRGGHPPHVALAAERLGLLADPGAAAARRARPVD